MIEQHDSFMREFRGNRAAPKPRLRPVAKEAPEGVALYQCHVVIPHGDDFHICGKGVEEKPYRPIPVHCDRPMTIVGYDWDRDVD